MQLAFFVVAASFKFDKVTDFAGSMNFVVLAVMSLIVGGSYTTRQVVATVNRFSHGIRQPHFHDNRDPAGLGPCRCIVLLSSLPCVGMFTVSCGRVSCCCCLYLAFNLSIKALLDVEGISTRDCQLWA